MDERGKDGGRSGDTKVVVVGDGAGCSDGSRGDEMMAVRVVTRWWLTWDGVEVAERRLVVEISSEMVERRRKKYKENMCVAKNDFKFMMIEEFCPSHEMQKLEIELWNHAMVGAGHAAYTDRFHELARLVPHLVTPECKKIERNGSIKKVKKRGNVGEPSKDKNDRDDNKRTRTGNAFVTTVNPIRRDNTGVWPKCNNCNSYHASRGLCCICFNCNRPGHLAKDYRGVPRNVNPVNVRNPTIRACYECGSTAMSGSCNQENQDRGRAFMLGAEEARQDPNIVMGTFTLNDHFVTTLFNSGADYFYTFVRHRA
nr:hypothetical protein [Tanacetum cinerariifolium]